MAAKNQIACFDKTWKVKNITLERNDLEKMEIFAIQVGIYTGKSA